MLRAETGSRQPRHIASLLLSAKSSLLRRRTIVQELWAPKVFDSTDAAEIDAARAVDRDVFCDEETSCFYGQCCPDEVVTVFYRQLAKAGYDVGAGIGILRYAGVGNLGEY